MIEALEATEYRERPADPAWRDSGGGGYALPVHRLAFGGGGAAPDRRALPDRGRDPWPPCRGAAKGSAGAQQAACRGLACLAHDPAGAGLWALHRERGGPPAGEGV